MKRKGARKTSKKRILIKQVSFKKSPRYSFHFCLKLSLVIAD
ncbi:hypothetical protein VFMJ11_B0163 (plasmid) [Aliivibrio fischeri MJ11]|uniref:Uncharacterized protein n=1 Tax=Aliivibrio fischeri (strain MJ11) TaxID=388396 RepID=B5EWA7_ALIFM|nr:hypothetical protein VFMJ11_B0163 [Aliivibrio fischeri MJ11]